MKAVFALVIVIVLGFIAQLFLPWWTIAIVCFLAGFTFIDKAKYGFLVGFFGVFLLWAALAFYKSYSNDFIMVDRVATLFADLFTINSKWLIISVTSLLGGIIGLLSTLSGYFLQTINEKPKRKRGYYS